MAKKNYGKFLPKAGSTVAVAVAMTVALSTQVSAAELDDTELLNDDNPVIRLVDGEAIVFGTPWSGKTHCYKNESVPLKAVVRLSQAPYNKISRNIPLQAYASLMPACSCMRWDRISTDALHRTVEKVISKVRCWHLECLPDADAAYTCHKAVTQ